MADITSSNSVLTIGVTDLFDTPQQLVGFANDDAYSFSSIEVSENLIGVDGIKSSGFLPTLKEMEVTLMADSPSRPNFFEPWFNAMENGQSIFLAFGTLNQPALGLVYTLTNGSLKGYVPASPAKKILMPSKFSIVWQQVSGAPSGG